MTMVTTTSLPGTYFDIPEPVASESKSHLVLYPVSVSEKRNNGVKLKWIGLLPLDMIDRVLLMAKQSTLSANEGMTVKRKCWPQNDNVGCDLLERFVLHERSSVAPQQCGEGNESFLNLISTIPDCERLLCVVKEFETLQMTTVVNSYNRVKEMFIARLSAASVQGDSSVDFIINETIDQVNAMIEMIRASTLAQHGSGRIDTQSASNWSTISIRDKNAFFKERLIDWLMRHWVNPFPDTAELNSLAIHFIQFDSIPLNTKDSQSLVACKSFEERRQCMMMIAIKKIETFLVNIRLRRWRKSIEDAFDLQRPAKLLLEDSLRLFQGKRLRSIEGWNSVELFASHSRYSKPLKAWKRTQKVSKAKMSSANLPSVSAPRPSSWQDVTPKRQRVASPKEQLSAAGLLELAKGVSVLSTRERKKKSPLDAGVTSVGGRGLSPIPMNLSYGTNQPLEDNASIKIG